MSWQEYAERLQFDRFATLQDCYEQSLIPQELLENQEDEQDW